VAAVLLEDLGVAVLRAQTGEQALETLRANPRIELLFTDIAMPGMTGWELAHAAKQMRPDLKILYTSGFIKGIPIGQHGLGYGPLLPKPWQSGQLRKKVSEVLGLQF
jgi:CheY-like chemotaxis protein